MRLSITAWVNVLVCCTIISTIMSFILFSAVKEASRNYEVAQRDIRLLQENLRQARTQVEILEWKVKFFEGER